VLSGADPWSAADPLVGLLSLRVDRRPGHHSGATFARRPSPPRELTPPLDELGNWPGRFFAEGAVALTPQTDPSRMPLCLGKACDCFRSKCSHIR